VTARCGIVLHPAGHTLSPVLHETAYRELGLDASFEVLDVPVGELEAALERARDHGMRQLAVSLPHKERALAFADEASTAAREIGAANTLTFTAGRAHADNTDWIGVRGTLGPLGPWEGRHALVIGAGGAARAVVYALRSLRMRVSIANRARERAERLARELGAELAGAGADPAYDLLVHATPVGMHPNPDATPLPAERLRPGSTVFDTVYRPLETRLLRDARERGCRAVDGLGMLVLQAAEQIRLWSGRSPDPSRMREAALRALRA
jgi:shikimate dehydrogenase